MGKSGSGGCGGKNDDNLKKSKRLEKETKTKYTIRAGVYVLLVRDVGRRIAETGRHEKGGSKRGGKHQPMGIILRLSLTFSCTRTTLSRQ